MERWIEFGKQLIVNESTFGETLVHVKFKCEINLPVVNTQSERESIVRRGQCCALGMSSVGLG